MTFWKKLSYLLITLLLLSSLLCVFSHRGTELECVSQFSDTALDESGNVGYVVERDGDTLHYTPVEGVEEPCFMIRGNGEDYRFLVIELSEPIDAHYPRISGNYEPFRTDENKWITGWRSADGMRVIFAIRPDMPTDYIWIRIDQPFTMQGFYGADYAGEPSLGFNPIALVILAASLTVLGLTERKFGYFAWIRKKIMGVVDGVKDSLRDGKTWIFALQLLTWAVTLVHLCGVALLFMFGHYSTTSILAVFWGTLATVVLQLAMRIVTGRGSEIAKLFLVVAVLLGVLLCYSMPPTLYVCWDDESHFDNAYELIHLFSNQTSLSEKLIYTHGLYPIESYQEDPSTFVSLLYNGGAPEVALYPTFCHPYQAFAYVPMMAAIALTSLIGTDVVQMVVLSRLFTLLTYAFIIYFGIRKLKNGAYIAATVALLPTALFLACSNNYDYWMTAWMIFGFSYFISLLQSPERKITGRDVAKMLVAFFLAFGPKAIYTFMLLPILFLKKDRFASPELAKKCRIWTIAVIGFVLATIIVPTFVVPDLYTDTRGGSDVSTGGQIAFILSHPFQYTRILLRFLAEYTSFVQMSYSALVYCYLGYSHTFYGTVVAFLLLYTIFTDRREDDAYEKMQGIRWITLLTCFAQIVLVATSLYVGFTPVGHETINGCQYRYIFPLLFPFCFFLVPKGIRTMINPKFQKTMVFGIMALTILASYYQSYLVLFVG